MLRAKSTSGGVMGNNTGNRFSILNNSFSPASISNLVLWLDAADPATITSSSGSVSQWNDKSGLNNNAVQATAGQQPTTAEKTINGNNVITFHGENSSQWMKILNMATNCQTVVAVWRGNAAYSNYNGIIVARSSLSTKTPNSTNASGFTQDLGVAGAVCNVGQITTAVYVDGTVQSAANFDNFAVGVQANPITSPHVILLQSSGNASGTQNYAIGADTFNPPGAGGRHLEGNIGEILIYDKVLNASEITNVNTYLRTKWGI